MIARRHIWEAWAQRLHRWGVEAWVAAWLESAGPLNLLGAQLLYIAQPWLQRTMPVDHFDALAELFEEHSQASSFAAFLRQEAVH